MTNANPKYELTIEKRPLYLYACVRAETISREVVLAYLSEILDAFRDAHYSRLLLVKEITESLALNDFEVIAKTLVQAGAQGIRIAVVDENADHKKVNKDGAQKARQAGLDVDFFSSFAPAVHWLLHG